MQHDLETQIRQRAYELWAAGGHLQGQAEQNWLVAEREVLATFASRDQAQPSRRSQTKSAPRSRRKAAA
ncbi:MAG: DUF2934 domain-containing protein [Variibacter sp.]|nr:DUF2934 domain-containing protein [Variibacter sp.]